MNFGGWMNFGGRDGTPHPPLRGPLDVCNANSTVACDMLPYWGRLWFSGTPQVSIDRLGSVGGGLHGSSICEANIAARPLPRLGISIDFTLNPVGAIQESPVPFVVTFSTNGLGSVERLFLGTCHFKNQKGSNLCQITTSNPNPLLPSMASEGSTAGCVGAILPLPPA